MLHIYATWGLWKSSTNGWKFVVDGKKRGRLLALESNDTFEELQMMVSEEFGIEDNSVDLELSYLPSELINNKESPPVIIATDGQVRNFVGYARNQPSTHLCVTCKALLKFNLNEEPPADSINGEDERRLGEKGEEFVTPNGKKEHFEFVSANGKKEHFKGNISDVEVDVGDGDDVVLSEDERNSAKTVRFSLVEAIKKKQHFRSKNFLKATMEIYAMQHNFDYKVIKSDTEKWIIRCAQNNCNWGLRAICLKGSTYFVVNKYVAEHTCSPSSQKDFGKTASAKTIGELFMHKYEGVKEGPRPNDIRQMMRTKYGCELSYSLAWDSREYAVAAVRGIPEKSYGKIPKYLHMLKEANPGTHSYYETDCDGRFKYLFIAFGQSIRGFYKAIRRVIVVDGTFLKSKYKGVLLVATALDGNSNLYPIAFGIVDSENDRSWEWFLRQLKVVIADERDLAFVSDRHVSIGKTLEQVYPQASHGICIHHLLTNVVTYFKGRGVSNLVAKASKAYRVTEFQRLFTHVCNISPGIGKYLLDADVTKWARCRFPGYRYDLRTTNPAESINSALRSPREYPVIPLLDSIREMLTRWFYERKKLSAKHTQHLTIEVEKKIDRRIEKGKKFKVYPVNEYRFLVRGDTFDCLVDLARRTCSCGKYDLLKIPCRHAIKAGYSLSMDPRSLSDEKYTTAIWRKAYEECINPIGVPEDAWQVPNHVNLAQVLPPETRRAAGRRRKRRFESVEDKIRFSQSEQRPKIHKCSRCGIPGHNRATCDRAI